MNYKLQQTKIDVWCLYKTLGRAVESAKYMEDGHYSVDPDVTSIKFKIFKSKLLQVMFL